MWFLDTSSNLYIRPLRRVDIEPATELVQRAFTSNAITHDVRVMLSIYCQSGGDQTPLELQTTTLLPVSYYTLALKEQADEHLAGITGLYRPIWAGEGVFWLGWFAIDPRFRGRGYGQSLLQASMAIARAKGGRLLCVETSNHLDAALHLYEKMGFRSCGEINDYWQIGANLIILGRDLRDIPIPQGIDTL